MALVRDLAFGARDEVLRKLVRPTVVAPGASSPAPASPFGAAPMTASASPAAPRAQGSATSVAVVSPGAVAGANS